MLYGPVTNSIQNGLMAAGYAAIFFASFKSKILKRFPFLVWASAVACIFNLFYDTAIYSPFALSVALLARLLTPLEACLLVSYSNVRLRLTLFGLIGVIIYSCANSQAVTTLGYLPIRNLATYSVTVVCIGTWFVNRYWPLCWTPIYSKHLALQTLWMILHSLFSLTARLYLTSWERRGVARWIYVLSALLIVYRYTRFMNPQAPAEEGSAAALEAESAR